MLWSLLALWDRDRSGAACWSHKLSQIVGPLQSASPDRSYDSGRESSVVVCGFKHCPYSLLQLENSSADIDYAYNHKRIDKM